MVHTAVIKGSDWYASIGGFRGIRAVDVDELLSRVGEAAHPSPFQLFDADSVAGWKHLYFAAVNAVNAFEGGTAISRSLAMESLLYASCQDQIDRALELIGISPETERAALLVLAKSLVDAERAFSGVSSVLGVADDSVLKVDGVKFERIKEAFGVSDLELEAVGGSREEALTWLVVERGALLSIRR
ncbi:MAG: KEOPS complex subunit Cgi121 [Candidatus Bathyarchaeota archaeon]|nr:KEOPS complex subunit Cgi121 [Candidatus Bathyarchaeota archaeon]